MNLTLTRTFARRSDPAVVTLTVEVSPADRAELEALLSLEGGRVSMRMSPVVEREPLRKACANGHPYTRENTYSYRRAAGEGKPVRVVNECRICRTDARDRLAARKARRAAR